MAATWFSDVDLEEASFSHHLQLQRACSIGQFAEQHVASATFVQNQNQELQRSTSSESDAKRPKKIAKTTSWDSGITEQSSNSSPMILSFGVPDAGMKSSKVRVGFYGGVKQPKEEVQMALPPGIKRGSDATKTNSGSNQDHILAERKRREKLSQRFIALSKILPGLKKMDKASVLGDAIKYLKQLEDKVQDLEGRAAKRPIESAIMVKKSRLMSDKDDNAVEITSCCDENFNSHRSTLKGLPEIEAKISEQMVLIKIHCENHKGALVKVLAEIETLGLTVTSTNMTLFAGTSLDITALAQVDEEFSMNVKDVVKKLNQALK